MIRVSPGGPPARRGRLVGDILVGDELVDRHARCRSVSPGVRAGEDPFCTEASNPREARLTVLLKLVPEPREVTDAQDDQRFSLSCLVSLPQFSRTPEYGRKGQKQQAEASQRGEQVHLRKARIDRAASRLMAQFTRPSSRRPPGGSVTVPDRVTVRDGVDFAHQDSFTK